MSGLGDAVKNGPRATSARVAHIEARIKVHEAKANKAAGQASEARRRAAKGNGPVAWYRRQEGDAMDTVAAQHRYKADELRTKLAEAKEQEARKEAKRVKQTVARTSDHPGQAGQRPGQAKPAGQPVAKPLDSEEAIRARNPNLSKITPGPLTESQRRVFTERDSGYKGWLDQDGNRVKAGPDGWPATTNPSRQEGTTMANGSGDAVNIEQTRALLNGWREQAQGLRDAIDQGSASLDSRGLQQLGGILAKNDDNLATFISGLDEFDGQLAGHEEIAEKGHALGEMGDAEFYGVG